MDLLDLMEHSDTLQQKIIDKRVQIRNRRDYLLNSGLKCVIRYKDKQVIQLRKELNNLYIIRSKGI